MTDEQYMARALTLAAKAIGHTHPNPMVGAVIVKDGRIIGEGYHHKAGQAHAEVNALNAAGEEAKGATLYVTLEPCAHYGKTPPCAKRVVESGIRRVVVSVVDPNPLVAGKGIAMLEAAGIEVTVGVLQAECTKLIEGFLTYIKTKRPFVTLKSAMSLDGKIATKLNESQWITNEFARKDGHVLRATHDAILVGIGTVLADNPSLTARLSYEDVASQVTAPWKQSIEAHHKVEEYDSYQNNVEAQLHNAEVQRHSAEVQRHSAEGEQHNPEAQQHKVESQYSQQLGQNVHQPDVIILDSLGRTPSDGKVFSQSQRQVHIFVSTRCDTAAIQRLTKAGATVHVVAEDSTGLVLDDVLSILGELGYTSLLVEGGSHIVANFMVQKCFDKIITYVGNILIGGEEALSAMAGIGIGHLTEAPKLEFTDVKILHNNLRIEAYHMERSGR